MSIIGTPTDWAGLIDPMVPEILNLVVTTWETLPPPDPDEKEDNITVNLCRALQNNRDARGLMFQIRTQVVELEPMAGEDTGRMDIVFIPLVPREDIYFCLESKRLNAMKNGKRRAYASEYIKDGMMRFITGQYSRAVRHAGMIAYVLDGNVSRARKNIATNIRRKHVTLRMSAPGTLLLSTILTTDPRARETHHQRAQENVTFTIHHLFMTN